jgi:hypothetical protein
MIGKYYPNMLRSIRHIVDLNGRCANTHAPVIVGDGDRDRIPFLAKNPVYQRYLHEAEDTLKQKPVSKTTKATKKED